MYLVEGKMKVCKDKIHESIPYKYMVEKYNDNEPEMFYETIYQEEKGPIHRCLSVQQDLLTCEGIPNAPLLMHKFYLFTG